MRRRIMLVLAAAAATQLTAGPAYAAIPDCFSYNTSFPWKTSLVGVDRVSASFGYTNFCGRDYLVDLGLESKFCEFPVPCRWVEINTAEELAKDGTSNGFAVEAPCRDGRHRYRLWWGVYSSDGFQLIGEGYGSDLELTCDNTPPPPDVQCDKFQQVCRVIEGG